MVSPSRPARKSPSVELLERAAVLVASPARANQSVGISHGPGHRGRAQLDALKAPSPEVATLQQKYVAILKQLVPLVEQAGKAGAANDANAYKAASEKIKAINTQVTAVEQQLYAAAP